MEEASALVAAVLSESADVAAVSEGTESGEVSYTVSGKYCGSSSARVTPPSTSSAIEEAICCACESALAFRVVRCAPSKETEADSAYDQKEEDHNQKFDEEQARTHPGIFFHRITGRAQDARHPPFESKR